MADGNRVITIDDDDDDANILSIFTTLLQRKGLIVDMAETGKEALRKMSKEHYDVALFDVMLPDVSGLDLLESISCETKKILITGTHSEESMRIALSKEAVAYLLKTVKPKKMLQLITG